MERCAVLLHLIDVNNEDVVQTYKTIRRELDLYNDKLANKPEVVVLNKIETLPADEVAQKQKALEKACGKKVVVISAVARENLMAALREVSQFVTRDRRKKTEETVDVRPEETGVKKAWSPLD